MLAVGNLKLILCLLGEPGHRNSQRRCKCPLRGMIASYFELVPDRDPHPAGVRSWIRRLRLTGAQGAGLAKGPDGAKSPTSPNKGFRDATERSQTSTGVSTHKALNLGIGGVFIYLRLSQARWSALRLRQLAL